MIIKTRLKGRKGDRSVQAIEVMIGKFAIDRIYLYEERNLRQFIVWMSKDYRDASKRVFPKLFHAIRKFTEYDAICYIGLEAVDRVRKGSLFLAKRCRREHMVYCREDDDCRMQIGEYSIGGCIGFSKVRMDIGMRKVDGFMDGYLHFYGRGDTVLAALMLHQAIELTYRYMEQLFTARERARHSIAEHHAYLGTLYAEVLPVFDSSVPADAAELEFLDSIYLDSRYSDHVDVPVEILRSLVGKFMRLRQLAADIYRKEVAKLGSGMKAMWHISDNLTFPSTIFLHVRWIPPMPKMVFRYIIKGATQRLRLRK